MYYRSNWIVVIVSHSFIHQTFHMPYMDGSMVSDLWCRIQHWRTVQQECWCWLTHCHSLDIIYVLVFHCIVFTRCLVVMWPDSVVFFSFLLHYMRILFEMPRCADNSCEKKKTKKILSKEIQFVDFSLFGQCYARLFISTMDCGCRWFK